MATSRYKPTGWRYESNRHSLAAKGIKTRLSFYQKEKADILKEADPDAAKEFKKRLSSETRDPWELPPGKLRDAAIKKIDVGYLEHRKFPQKTVLKGGVVSFGGTTKAKIDRLKAEAEDRKERGEKSNMIYQYAQRYSEGRSSPSDFRDLINKGYSPSDAREILNTAMKASRHTEEPIREKARDGQKASIDETPEFEKLVTDIEVESRKKSGLIRPDRAEKINTELDELKAKRAEAKKKGSLYIDIDDLDDLDDTDIPSGYEDIDIE